MKQLVVVACLACAACFAARSANAQSEAPVADPSAENAVAGAPGDDRASETYLPGPGGGELEGNEPLPNESTGLGDGPGSCKCNVALGGGSSATSPLLSLVVALGLLRRRAAKDSSKRPVSC